MVPDPENIIEDLRHQIAFGRRCARVAFRRAIGAVIFMAAIYLIVIWYSCR
jgi:hypothetical protein